MRIPNVVLVPLSSAIVESTVCNCKQNLIIGANYINKLEYCCANYA